MHQHRFSYLSCETDDSESLATPLDASPYLPLATHVITVVPNESLTDRPHIPTIATNRRRHPSYSSTTETEQRRRRQQQRRHLEQSSTVAMLQQPLQRRRSWSLSSSLPSSPSNLWPRLKQMVSRFHMHSSSSTDSDNKPVKKQQHDKDADNHIEQQDDLSSQLSALKISPKAEDNKRRLWLFDKKQKKTRIQPS
ncbi:hypothetical protein BDB00DRAFT_876007 [Zychaea mexicana]|uniref:uncharacterized protein n=1 Tax=Zychaea mexicana TaxID=64656 RepID=UPI0022FDE5FE|nr:uncharacterized protein BDB00DRAFT_876007 [Zychaea mexicana]KAI9489779.1 hypothetical protein BDB00DRAFT_876007 [Zychaea mexicana]